METRNPPCDSALMNQSLQTRKTQLFVAAVKLQRKLGYELHEKFNVELSPNYVRPAAMAEDDHRKMLSQLEQLQQFCEYELTMENFLSFFIGQLEKWNDFVDSYNLKALFKFTASGVSRIAAEAKYLLQLQEIVDLKNNLHWKLKDKSLELEALLQRELATEADYLNFFVEAKKLCQKDAKVIAELTKLQEEVIAALETFNRQVTQNRYVIFRHLQSEGEERLVVNDVLRDRALDADQYITIPNQKYHYEQKIIANDFLGDGDLEVHVNCHLNPQGVAGTNRRKAWDELKQELKVKIIKLFMRGELTKNNINLVLRSIVLQALLVKLQQDYLFEEKKILLRWHIITPRANLEFHAALDKNIRANDNCEWFAGRQVKSELFYLINELERNNEAGLDYAAKQQTIKKLLLETEKKFADDLKLKLANQFYHSADILGTFVSQSLNNLARLDSFMTNPENSKSCDCLDKEAVEFVTEVKEMMQEIISPTPRMRAGTDLSSESQEKEGVTVFVTSRPRSEPSVSSTDNPKNYLGKLDVDTEPHSNSAIPNRQPVVPPHRQKKNPSDEKAIVRSMLFAAAFALLCIGVAVIVILTAPITLPYLATAGSILGAGTFGGLLGFGIDQATQQETIPVEKPRGVNATTYSKIKKDLVPGDNGFVPPRKYTNAALIGRRPADRGFAGTTHGTYSASLRRRSQRGIAPQPQKSASFTM